MARPKLTKAEKMMKGTYRPHRDRMTEDEERLAALDAAAISPLRKYANIRVNSLANSPDSVSFDHTTHYRELYQMWEVMTPEQQQEELDLLNSEELNFQGRAKERKALKLLLEKIMRGYRHVNPFLPREEWIAQTREAEAWEKTENARSKS